MEAAILIGSHRTLGGSLLVPSFELLLNLIALARRFSKSLEEMSIGETRDALSVNEIYGGICISVE